MAPRLEEYQLRLESDENAVNLVTVHKSKGLEYPIVFCPFSWEGLQVRALRRQRSNYRSPSALFLNLQGNAVSKTRLTAVFAEAFRAAGVAGSLH